MDGSAGVKSLAGTGTEQTRFHWGNRRIASGCDAKCDAISADRIELLARAVVRVAACGFPRRRGRQCEHGSRPTGHLRTVALTNDRKSRIEEIRVTTNLGHP